MAVGYEAPEGEIGLTRFDPTVFPGDGGAEAVDLGKTLADRAEALRDRPAWPSILTVGSADILKPSPGLALAAVAVLAFVFWPRQ